MTAETKARGMQLIQDGDLLSAEAIVDVLVGRGSELAQLRTCLAPMLRGQQPVNVWLCGPPGSGKTTLARRVVQATCGAGARVGVHVNCWQHRSLYSALQAIMDELKIMGAEAQDTNVKLDKLRQALRGRPAVVVLDEVDRPMPGQREDIIYGLLSLPKVGLICVANSTNPLAVLGDRVRSRLSPVVVELPAYSAREIELILADRATQALVPGTWTQPLLRRIAQLADGDARLAIQTLRQAAVAAEENGSRKISGKYVEDRARQWQVIPAQQRSAGLSEHERIIEQLARQHGPVGTAELARLYLSHCRTHKLQPMAGRTFRKYLSRMGAAGVLDLSQATAATGGRFVTLRAG